MGAIKTYFDNIINENNLHIMLKLLAIEDKTKFENIINLMMRGYISISDLTHLLELNLDDESELEFISNITDVIDMSTVERPSGKLDQTYVEPVQDFFINPG